jgi:hypothetical protein
VEEEEEELIENQEFEDCLDDVIYDGSEDNDVSILYNLLYI